MPATNVWHLDDSISYDIGGIHDPMGNAFHTALTANIPGAVVLITGCGPIGAFAVGICKAAGAARIIATDVNPTSTRTRSDDGGARRGAPGSGARRGHGRDPMGTALTWSSKCPGCHPRCIRPSHSHGRRGASTCWASPPSHRHRLRHRDHLQGADDLRGGGPPDVRHLAPDEPIHPLRQLRPHAGDHAPLAA
jgi:hypothetical protein